MSQKTISFRISPSSGHQCQSAVKDHVSVLKWRSLFCLSLKAHSLSLKLCPELSSYHCLHIHSAQPDPAASLRPLASPELQKDSWHPEGTERTKFDYVWRKMVEVAQKQYKLPNNEQGWRHFQSVAMGMLMKSHLLVGIGPVWARNVPQVSSVLYLIMPYLLVLQPHNAVPELRLIWATTDKSQLALKSMLLISY